MKHAALVPARSTMARRRKHTARGYARRLSARCGRCRRTGVSCSSMPGTSGARALISNRIARSGALFWRKPRRSWRAEAELLGLAALRALSRGSPLLTASPPDEHEERQQADVHGQVAERNAGRGEVL